MLASYESSQHGGGHICCGLFMFTVENRHSPRMQGFLNLIVMNLILGSCRPWASCSTGFANGHCEYTSAVRFGYNLVCDDPRITVLHHFLDHHSLEGKDQGRDEKVGKCCGDGLLGYRNDEVRVSHVGGKRRGELPVWLVKFAWIRACVQLD